jgi:hypothetical protein
MTRFQTEGNGFLALFELFGWLKCFRERRRRENLIQRELLKKELRLLAYAILGVFIVMGFLIGLAWIFTR